MENYNLKQPAAQTSAAPTTVSPALMNTNSNYFVNSYAASNPGSITATSTAQGASPVSGVAMGAAAGAVAGSAVPILGNILGAAAGALIGGVFDLIGGHYNREEAARQQAEAKEMAERQFAWGQKMDRFNMDAQTKQQTHALAQSRINEIKGQIGSNAALQDRLRNIFTRGGK